MAKFVDTDFQSAEYTGGGATLEGQDLPEESGGGTWQDWGTDTTGINIVTDATNGATPDDAPSGGTRSYIIAEVLGSDIEPTGGRYWEVTGHHVGSASEDFYLMLDCQDTFEQGFRAAIEGDGGVSSRADTNSNTGTNFGASVLTDTDFTWRVTRIGDDWAYTLDTGSGATEIYTRNTAATTASDHQGIGYRAANTNPRIYTFEMGVIEPSNWVTVDSDDFTGSGDLFTYDSDWSSLESSTFTISSNKVNSDSTGLDTAVKTIIGIDSDSISISADIDFSADVTDADIAARLMIDVQDASNYWYLLLTPDAITIYKRVSGSDTSVASKTFTTANISGGNLEFQRFDGRFYAVLDGMIYASVADDNALPKTGTVGFGLNDTGDEPTLDNWLVKSTFVPPSLTNQLTEPFTYSDGDLAGNGGWTDAGLPGHFDVTSNEVHSNGTSVAAALKTITGLDTSEDFHMKIDIDSAGASSNNEKAGVYWDWTDANNHKRAEWWYSPVGSYTRIRVTQTDSGTESHTNYNFQTPDYEFEAERLDIWEISGTIYVAVDGALLSSSGLAVDTDITRTATIAIRGQFTNPKIDNLEVDGTVSATAFDIPTADISVTSPLPTSTSSATFDIPTADVTATAPAPTSTDAATYAVPTAGIAVTAPAPTSTDAKTYAIPSADVTVVAPVPTISADGTFNVPTADITITAPLPTSTSAATFAVPVADVTVTAPVPTSTDNATYNIPAADTSVTSPVPTSTEARTSQIPTADIAVTAPVPTLSADGTFAVPTANVIATAPTPVVTSSATYAIPVSSVSVTAPIPAFNAQFAVPVADVTAGSPVPTVVANDVARPPVADVVVAAPTPSLSGDATFDVPAATIAVSAPVPTSLQTTVSNVPVSVVTITGPVPTVTSAATFSIVVAGIAVTSPVPSVINGAIPPDTSLAGGPSSKTTITGGPAGKTTIGTAT